MEYTESVFTIVESQRSRETEHAADNHRCNHDWRRVSQVVRSHRKRFYLGSYKKVELLRYVDRYSSGEAYHRIDRKEESLFLRFVKRK